MSSARKTKLESWQEWKRKCALKPCSDAAKEDLSSFGGPIIVGLCRKFDPDLTIPSESNVDRWHLFESYMHLRSGTTGKRWKDWLFEKAAGSTDDPATVLEKEAYHCMWTTVLQFCNREGRSKERKVGQEVVSKDAPASDGPGAPLIGDSLQIPAWLDPASQAEWAELQEIAKTEADRHFAAMKEPPRVALLANALGLSLANPGIERIADRKSSVLYDYLTKLPSEIRLTIDRDYSSEDVRTVDALIALTIETLRELSLIWGKSEKRMEPLFVLAEDTMKP